MIQSVNTKKSGYWIFIKTTAFCFVLAFSFGFVNTNSFLNTASAAGNSGRIGKTQAEAVGIKEKKSAEQAQKYIKTLLNDIADLTKKMQNAEKIKDMIKMRKIADKLSTKLAEHADFLLAGGHLTPAASKYFASVQLDQGNYKALTGLGYVLLQQGMFEQAVITLTRAVEEYPVKLSKDEKSALYMAYNNLGICLIEMARRDFELKQKLYYSKAARNLKKAIKLDPKHHFAYFNLARVYEGREAYSMAVENYEKAIKKNPNDNEAYIAAARLYKDELNDTKKAMIIINKAIKNVPNASAIHSFKADLQLEQKAISGAYFNYWTEFFKNPATPWSRHALEKIKSLMVSEYKKIDSKDPLHLFMKGYKFFQDKSYDKSVDLYNKALIKAPKNFMVMLMLADTYKYQKEYKKAIDIYIKAIKASNKKFAFLYYELANTLMKIKQYDRASELLTDALILDPINMQYYINKGICLMETKKHVEAINILYQGCARFPDSTFGHYNLGKAFFLNQQIIEAKQEFDYIINKKTGSEIKKAAQSYIRKINGIMAKAKKASEK